MSIVVLFECNECKSTTHLKTYRSPSPPPSKPEMLRSPQWLSLFTRCDDREAMVVARRCLSAEDRVSRGMAVVLMPSLNGGGFDIFKCRFCN